MNKPMVIFFARGYQADFFPHLQSDSYCSGFVVLTRAERQRVENLGGKVVACFEEDYDALAMTPISESYLMTSFMSDRFLGRFSYRKRLEILGKEVSFWAGVLDQYTPQAVVNELVAIEISEVLLIECRRRNIRYLAGMNCLIDGYFYWLENPLSLSGKHLQERAPSKDSLEAANRYVEELLAKDYKPFYVKDLRGRRDLAPVAVALAKTGYWLWRRLAERCGGGFSYEMYDDEYWKRLVVFMKGLFLKYDDLDEIPGGKEIIYYPLHQEPEATLNYMSEFYANQVATIENIMRCLNANQVLVVKEHPVDKGALLRRKFAALKRTCSGLYYLPAERHGREVLAVANRVVTLTSTVGWEAAVLGKRVYVLGKIFYDHFNGVTAVSDFSALRLALTTPAGGTWIEKGSVEHFVANMLEQSDPGNPFPHAQLYSAANIRRVTDSIVRAVGGDRVS